MEAPSPNEPPKPRILIVEDNADDGELLMRQLKKARLGDHVKVIRDGSQAIQFLTDATSGAGHLIAMFLDLQLPSLDGLSVLEQVRAHESICRLPVIVMTSSNSQEDLHRCRVLGVSSYVQKPVTFSAFTKAVADTFHVVRPR
ncbi:MAG: response regulator [Verrucomicrobiota bacterium]